MPEQYFSMKQCAYCKALVYIGPFPCGNCGCCGYREITKAPKDMLVAEKLA